MRLRREPGQDMVEYALVLPLLMLLIFGVIEFGMLFFSYVTIANAAREGARAGILPPTTACDTACRDAAILAVAESRATGLAPTALTVTVTRPTATTVHVHVTYNAPLLTGPMIAALGGTTSIPLQVTATMQLE